MSIYLDSAIYDQAKLAADTGWIRGITTNPTLLANSGLPPAETLKNLAGLDVQEIYYQVRSNPLAAMKREMEMALEILGEKLVVKIPPTQEGFRFGSYISGSQKTCITAIFTPAQALVAREIRADYIAIYVNRATRLLGDGIQLTQSIAEVLANSSTEIIAASLKSPEEVTAAFKAGAQHQTLPFEIFSKLLDSQFSQQAVDQFDQTQAYLS